MKKNADLFIFCLFLHFLHNSVKTSVAVFSSGGRGGGGGGGGGGGSLT